MSDRRERAAAGAVAEAPQLTGVVDGKPGVYGSSECGGSLMLELFTEVG